MQVHVHVHVHIYIAATIIITKLILVERRPSAFAMGFPAMASDSSHMLH